jgi:hypothetical protein
VIEGNQRKCDIQLQLTDCSTGFLCKQRENKEFKIIHFDILFDILFAYNPKFMILTYCCMKKIKDYGKGSQ